MRGMADDWEAGGPTRMACRGYETAPRGALIQLRLLAGVFRLVLTGQAPELIRFYPCLGGTDPASEAWPVIVRWSARTSSRFTLSWQSRPQPTKSVDPRRCSPDSSILSPPRCAPHPAAGAWSERRAQTVPRPVRVSRRLLTFRTRAARRFS